MGPLSLRTFPQVQPQPPVANQLSMRMILYATLHRDYVSSGTASKQALCCAQHRNMLSMQSVYLSAP